MPPRKNTAPADPTTSPPEPEGAPADPANPPAGASAKFNSAFGAAVVTTPDLDVKTYRLANRLASAADERALAERVLQLELAPAELKAQATALLAG